MAHIRVKARKTYLLDHALTQARILQNAILSRENSAVEDGRSIVFHDGSGQKNLATYIIDLYLLQERLACWKHPKSKQTSDSHPQSFHCAAGNAPDAQKP